MFPCSILSHIFVQKEPHAWGRRQRQATRQDHECPMRAQYANGHYAIALVRQKRTGVEFDKCLSQRMVDRPLSASPPFSTSCCREPIAWPLCQARPCKERLLRGFINIEGFVRPQSRQAEPTSRRGRVESLWQAVGKTGLCLKSDF